MKRTRQKLLQIHNALQKVMFLDLIIAADTYAKLDEKRSTT